MTGGEDGEEEEALIYLRSRVVRVKGSSSFHMSQPCSSQPPSLEEKTQRRRDREGGGQTWVQQRPQCKLYSNKAVKVNTLLKCKDVFAWSAP